MVNDRIPSRYDEVLLQQKLDEQRERIKKYRIFELRKKNPYPEDVFISLLDDPLLDNEINPYIDVLVDNGFFIYDIENKWAQKKQTTQEINIKHESKKRCLTNHDHGRQQKTHNKIHKRINDYHTNNRW